MPGLVSIIVFYLLILVVGIIAARKTGLKMRNLSRQEVMMAGRNIGLFVGLFTITGGWGCSPSQVGGAVHRHRWVGLFTITGGWDCSPSQVGGAVSVTGGWGRHRWVGLFTITGRWSCSPSQVCGAFHRHRWVGLSPSQVGGAVTFTGGWGRSVLL